VNNIVDSSYAAGGLAFTSLPVRLALRTIITPRLSPVV
jgi:hypothetical protein